jgi:Ubiquitin 3 binding protein But2 C-terminal domain
MKLFLVTSTTLIAGVNALFIPNVGCSFKLTAAGDASGQISQLDDGQSRVAASGLSAATFSIGADGGIFDQNGRGCISATLTTQLQCDAGTNPTTGFSIACDGTLSYSGNSRFVACQTGGNGWNIYTTASLDQTRCVHVTLNADSCLPGCPSSSPSPQSSSPSASASSTPTAPKACPANLSGIYQCPHLITPVSSTNPDKAHGTSYNGRVSKYDIRTIFNFNFPTSYTGKTCSLVFLFPRQDQLQASSFTISGDGSVGFTSLTSVANQQTTHNNAPVIAQDYGAFSLSPGNLYTVASFDCPAGTTQSYSMISAGTDFRYFQDYNAAP